MRKRTGKNGARWMGVYEDEAGRERSAGSFPTKKEAKQAAEEEERKIRRREWVDPDAGRVTFGDYAEAWFASLVLEVNTLAGYRGYLNNHFLPVFAAVPIRDIGPGAVQAWIRAAVAAGLAPATIAKCHTMLGSIFRQAIREGVIGRNPCALTKLPKQPKRKRLAVPSPAQVEEVIEHLRPMYRLMVRVAMETGMRMGELTALRPRALDVDNCSIIVRDTLVEVAKKYSPTGKRFVHKALPKDDEERVLRISAQLMADLLAERDARRLGPDELFFTAPRGRGPVSRPAFRTREWIPALRAAGVDPRLRFHDLRHSHATWLLAGGADVETVRERLGHSNLRTTQSYLHTLDDSGLRAMAALETARQMYGPMTAAGQGPAGQGAPLTAAARGGEQGEPPLGAGPRDGEQGDGPGEAGSPVRRRPPGGPQHPAGPTLARRGVDTGDGSAA